MQVTEPMTMATDFALAGLCALWSVMSLRIARRERQRSVALWGGGLMGFAAASIAGGSYHGLAVAPQSRVFLWTLVTVAMGLASFLMLCAAVIAMTTGKWRLALLAAALVKLAIFAIWIAGSNEFALLMADYGSAQLAILVLAGCSWRSDRNPSAPWLAASIAMSVLGAGVQHSGFALHEHFNHNDLYHVIQMVGLYWMYRGGALFRDRA
ncbi:MAG: hypothetical protein ABI054_10830 [Planctomycetota bacterium]